MEAGRVRESIFEIGDSHQFSTSVGSIDLTAAHPVSIHPPQTARVFSSKKGPAERKDRKVHPSEYHSRLRNAGCLTIHHSRQRQREQAIALCSSLLKCPQGGEHRHDYNESKKRGRSSHGKVPFFARRQTYGVPPDQN